MNYKISKPIFFSTGHEIEHEWIDNLSEAILYGLLVFCLLFILTI